MGQNRARIGAYRSVQTLYSPYAFLRKIVLIPQTNDFSHLYLQHAYMLAYIHLCVEY